jgi:trans-aconitate 2-methyltransferase
MEDKWDGKYYKENSNPQEQTGLKIVDSVVFGGNERVLDLGCGDGRITSYIAKKVPQGSVIGIDVSPNMIQLAKENFAQIPNLSFKIADAATFNLDQKFDYVFSFSTLHWVEDLIAVFKNIKNVLHHNGKLIFTIGSNQDSQMKKAFEVVCNIPKWKPHFEKHEDLYRSKTASELEELLESAGFENKTIEVFHRTALYESFDGFVKWLMACIPHNTGLPKEKALEFSKDIAENIYKQENENLNEPIKVHSPFLKVNVW